MLIFDAENLKNTIFLHVKKMVNFGFSARIIGVMTRSDYAWLAAMRVRSRASPHNAELQGRALAIRTIFTLDFYAWHKNLHKTFLHSKNSTSFVKFISIEAVVLKEEKTPLPQDHQIS